MICGGLEGARFEIVITDVYAEKDGVLDADLTIGTNDAGAPGGTVISRSASPSDARRCTWSGAGT